MSISPEELTLLEMIRADPKAQLPLKAYCEWLEANSEPERAEIIRLAADDVYPIHREAMQYGHYYGPRDKTREASRTRIGQIIATHFKNWTEGLPLKVSPNYATHTGLGSLRGMPFVTAAYRPSVTPEDFNDRVRAISPRIMLELEIRAHPATLDPAEKGRWWGGWLNGIAPSLQRASRIELIFRSPDAIGVSGRMLRLGPPLLMKPALAIVTELAELIDGRRTPWVRLYCPSKAVKQAAEKLLGPKGIELSVCE